MVSKVQLVGRPRFRRELRALVDDGELVVVGEAGDPIEACSGAETLCPDVVVIDGELLGREAFTLIAAVKQCCAQARIVFCAPQPGADEVRGALGAGAAGVIGTHQPPREIAAAIRIVADGGSYLCPMVARPRDVAP
jgi:DNA-binding NarL/FixJ family response regulator